MMAEGSVNEEFDVYYVTGQRLNGYETHLLRRMSFKRDFVLAITQLGHMPFTCVEEAAAHREIERIHTEERIRHE